MKDLITFEIVMAYLMSIVVGVFCIIRLFEKREELLDALDKKQWTEVFAAFCFFAICGGISEGCYKLGKKMLNEQKQIKVNRLTTLCENNSATHCYELCSFDNGYCSSINKILIQYGEEEYQLGHFEKAHEYFDYACRIDNAISCIKLEKTKDKIKTSIN